MELIYEYETTPSYIDEFGDVDYNTQTFTYDVDYDRVKEAIYNILADEVINENFKNCSKEGKALLKKTIVEAYSNLVNTFDIDIDEEMFREELEDFFRAEAFRDGE